MSAPPLNGPIGNDPVEVVLGGMGSIGQHLVRSLRSSGAEVLVFDLENGHDLRGQAPPLPERDCYIWFLAWDVGGAKYLMDESKQLHILHNNLELCQRVFTWIRARGFRSTFIGSQMAGYDNAYGLTKMVGEYWATLTPECITARLWNVYCLEEPSQRSHVVTDLVHSGLEGTVRCGTTGEERRQFLYVKDCIEGLLHQRRTGQLLADITTGEWVTVRDLAGAVADAMGRPVAFGDRPGYEHLVDPSSPLEGWGPRYNLAGGVREMLQESGIIASPGVLSRGTP